MPSSPLFAARTTSTEQRADQSTPAHLKSSSSSSSSSAAAAAAAAHDKPLASSEDSAAITKPVQQPSKAAEDASSKDTVAVAKPVQLLAKPTKADDSGGSKPTAPASVANKPDMTSSLFADDDDDLFASPAPHKVLHQWSSMTSVF